MNAGDFFINEKVLENIFTSNRNEDLISGIAQIPQGFWYPPEEKYKSFLFLDVQLRTSEHRSMYSYVRLSIDRCTATYV